MDPSSGIAKCGACTRPLALICITGSLCLMALELSTSLLSTDGGPTTVAQEGASTAIYACLCDGIACNTWLSLSALAG